MRARFKVLAVVAAVLGAGTLREKVVRGKWSGATVRVHVVEVCAASLDFCRPGQPNLFLETGEALCADFRRGKLRIQ